MTSSREEREKGVEILTDRMESTCLEWVEDDVFSFFL